jgi:phosphopantetheinyl transferase
VAIGPVSSVADRRALLRSLVARLLSVSDDAVVVAHVEGHSPQLVQPSGVRLYLSSASRDGLAAVAVAILPVGVDVERVDRDGDLPWNVLHPAEAAALRDLPEPERADLFARLWSCKEAYLKALGVGLHRESRSFAVRTDDGRAAKIDDGSGSVESVTRWHAHAGSRYAVSTVILPAQPGLEPRVKTTDRIDTRRRFVGDIGCEADRGRE